MQRRSFLGAALAAPLALLPKSISARIRGVSGGVEYDGVGVVDVELAERLRAAKEFNEELAAIQKKWQDGALPRGLSVRDETGAPTSAGVDLTVDGKSAMIRGFKMEIRDGELATADCQVYLTDLDLWVEAFVCEDCLFNVGNHFGYQIKGDKSGAVNAHLVTKHGQVVEFVGRDGWRLPASKDALKLDVQACDLARVDFCLPDIGPGMVEHFWDVERFLDVCYRFGYATEKMPWRELPPPLPPPPRLRAMSKLQLIQVLHEHGHQATTDWSRARMLDVLLSGDPELR